MPGVPRPAARHPKARQFRQPPRAVAEAVVEPHGGLVELADEQVRHRRVARIAEVTLAPELPAAAADEHQRQVVVEVLVAVAPAGGGQVALDASAI